MSQWRTPGPLGPPTKHGPFSVVHRGMEGSAALTSIWKGRISETSRGRHRPWCQTLRPRKAVLQRGARWPIQQEQGQWVCFILGDGSSALTLHPWDELAAEAGLSADGSGFRGMSLSYNVRSEERVNEVLAEAEHAGGKITKPPTSTSWGGYSGYFTDPEGYLWEVATGATKLPSSE
jgi:catechol 2,3-dioxygenase-like lactoylglutathione lyase family enzyme